MTELLSAPGQPFQMQNFVGWYEIVSASVRVSRESSDLVTPDRVIMRVDRY